MNKNAKNENRQENVGESGPPQSGEADIFSLNSNTILSPVLMAEAELGPYGVLILPFEDDDIMLPSDCKRASFLEASANIINCIVGAGIVGMPYAISRSGIILGPLILFFIAATIDFSVKLLVTSGKLSSTMTYPSLMRKLFGKPGYFAISIAQVLVSFGALVIEMIMIGDNLANIVSNIVLKDNADSSLAFLADRYVVLATVSLVVILPLSLVKHVKDAALISIASVIGCVLLIGGTVAGCWRIILHNGDTWLNNIAYFKPAGIVETSGISCFAFICHGVVFMVFNTLKKPTLDHFSSIIHCSVMFSCVAFLAVGFPAYAAFGEGIQGNVLNGFPVNDYLMSFIRIVFTANLILCIPLDIFVIRDVLDHFLDKSTHFYTSNNASTASRINAANNQPTDSPTRCTSPGTIIIRPFSANKKSNVLHFTVTFTMLFFATLIAIFFINVNDFLETTVSEFI